MLNWKIFAVRRWANPKPLRKETAGELRPVRLSAFQLHVLLQEHRQACDLQGVHLGQTRSGTGGGQAWSGPKRRGSGTEQHCGEGAGFTWFFGPRNEAFMSDEQITF